MRVHARSRRRRGWGRPIAIAVAVALCSLIVSGSVLSASAAPAQVNTAGREPSAALVPTGVDDFTFASFDGDYRLDRDTEGHSTLTTVETLVARFPETDQNHGIRRKLVENYDGHPTDLEVVSVADENGIARSYTSESEDGILSLTIAAKGYVHGDQTYVITYRQTYVTRYFADTDNDEFYWDTNGTEWAQPFDRVTATVHLGSGLTKALQSPEGAERAPVSVDDPREMLTLNERLLPWAVLFGDEKKWLAELGSLYEQTGQTPTWYSGQTAFNVAVLSQMVSGISSSTTIASSSSSGGTGGGGFSGGGGGGGGGGGV